jgi:hypothetical protein
MAETTAQPPAGNLPPPGTTQSAADPNRTVVRQPPGPV